jgi:hypothetical protein
MDDTKRSKSRYSIKRCKRGTKSLKITDKVGSTEVAGELDKIRIGKRLYRPRPRKLSLPKSDDFYLKRKEH